MSSNTPNYDDADHWVYPVKKYYQPYIVDLMSFFHAANEYEKDHSFTREELLELRPNDIKRWLADKAYHDPDYDISRGDRPTGYRSESISFATDAS